MRIKRTSLQIFSLPPHFVIKMWRRGIAFCFGQVVKWRNRLYDRGILEEKRGALPVISVGNIEVGGTGKTPVVMLLAESLQKKLKVAVVSRGYRSKAEKASSPLLVSKGSGPLSAAKICGDEVYMMASRLPGVIVVAGRDREKGVALAADAGAEVAILDDGMQYRKLTRDVEILVLGNEEHLRAGKFIPYGRLRDEPRRAAEADLLVTQGKADFGFAVPTVQMENRVQKVLFTDGQTSESLEGSLVGLFCGIANPQRFVETIEKRGAKVVATCFASDHCQVQPKSFARFALQAKRRGAKWLLCTEKDAVKGFPYESCGLPIGWVRNSLIVKEGQENWNLFMDKIFEIARRSKR